LFRSFSRCCFFAEPRASDARHQWNDAVATIQRGCSCGQQPIEWRLLNGISHWLSRTRFSLLLGQAKLFDNQRVIHMMTPPMHPPVRAMKNSPFLPHSVIINTQVKQHLVWWIGWINNNFCSNAQSMKIWQVQRRLRNVYAALDWLSDGGISHLPFFLYMIPSISVCPTVISFSLMLNHERFLTNAFRFSRL
jgi:hypothetical protein